jgi:hypothetical protein
MLFYWSLAALSGKSALKGGSTRALFPGKRSYRGSYQSAFSRKALLKGGSTRALLEALLLPTPAPAIKALLSAFKGQNKRFKSPFP